MTSDSRLVEIDSRALENVLDLAKARLDDDLARYRDPDDVPGYDTKIATAAIKHSRSILEDADRDDVELRLISIGEQLDEVREELESRSGEENYNARSIAGIVGQTSDLILDVSHALEKLDRTNTDRFRIDDDDLLTDGGQIVEDDLEDEFQLVFTARKTDLIELENVLNTGLVEKTAARDMTPPDHRMILEVIRDLYEILDVDEANRNMAQRLETGQVLVGESIETELFETVRPLKFVRSHLENLDDVGRDITESIRINYQNNPPGANLGDVIEQVIDAPDHNLADVGLKLYVMYVTGEIYSPQDDTVALTETDGGRFVTIQNGERVERTEREILDDLVDRGVARPIPEYDHSGKICVNPSCDDIVPENDYKSLNLGIESGHCSLTCLLEDEERDDDLRTDGGSPRGLYSKYTVLDEDGDPVHDRAFFILEPESDPAARKAISAYASATEDENLSNDLWDWLIQLSGDDGGDDVR